MEADSDIPEGRRGVRVFRHGLVDKAAEMAEAMTDDQIRGSDGVRNGVRIFDDHHAQCQKISDHEDFERELYGYERSPTETYKAYVAKKREPVAMFVTIVGYCPMLMTVVANAKEEHQSSTSVLHNSGHPPTNVVQDMESWRKAILELESLVRTPETETLLRQFAITADDSKNHCETDPS